MERIHVLGTGNALVTHCYNTCFYLELDEGGLLVDCGGGNGILRQLEDAGIDPVSIRHIFVSHEHCDHILGVVWLVRMIGTAMNKGSREGDLTIHCHAGLAESILTFCCCTLGAKLTGLFGRRIHIRPVADGEERVIGGRSFTFFDIRSTKAPQFGFAAQLAAGRLTFMGDEPVNPSCEDHARGARWLLSEAFCLAAEADRFKPYEKHHSTAADAARLAARLGAENLVLWHTEESDLAHRKARYTAEAQQFFAGGVYVPDDLDVIDL